MPKRKRLVKALILSTMSMFSLAGHTLPARIPKETKVVYKKSY